MTEAQVLAREFSTPFRKLAAVTSKKIIERSPLTQKTKLTDISELRFLHFLGIYLNQIAVTDMAYEEMLERAASEARVSKDWAERFMASKRYARWVNDRLAEIAVVEGLTVGYLAEKLKAGIEGTVKYNDSQKFCLDQATRRVWPEVSKIEQKIVTEEASSMDELAQARQEVEALEKQLKDAVAVPTTAKEAV